MRCLTSAIAVWLVSSLFPLSVDAAIISVTDRFGNSNISITEGTPTVDVYIRVAPSDPGNLGADDPDGDGVMELAGMDLHFRVGDGGLAPDGQDLNLISGARLYNTHAPGDPDINRSVWDPVLAQLGSASPSILGSRVAANLLGLHRGNPNAPTVEAPVNTPGHGNVLAVIELSTAGLVAGQTDSVGTPNGFILYPDMELDGSNNITGVFAHVAGQTGGTALPLNTTPPQNPGDTALDLFPAILTITPAAAAIPEPSSMLLLAMGTAVVGGRHLRRRSRSQTSDATTDEAA